MKYFVFDVESAGLNGDGFAVGYVVIEDGHEIACGYASSGINSVECGADNLKWLLENLPKNVLCPENPITLEQLRNWFYDQVKKFPDAAMVSDCGFPVEVNFLKACGVQPYPLHEVATALLLAGFDPVGTYDRRPNELPQHHPLFDSRQSARMFLRCIEITKSHGRPT